MRDFSEKYRGVVYFGLCVEETADEFGKMDAWKVLTGALKRTRDEDVRCQELADALGYLRSQGMHKRALSDFAAALDVVPPDERYMHMRHALQRIWKGL